MIREILDTVDVEWCTQSITKAQRMYPSLSMFGLVQLSKNNPPVTYDL